MAADAAPAVAVVANDALPEDFVAVVALAIGADEVGIFATSGGTGIKGALKDLEKQYPHVEFAGAELMNKGVKDFL